MIIITCTQRKIKEIMQRFWFASQSFTFKAVKGTKLLLVMGLTVSHQSRESSVPLVEKLGSGLLLQKNLNLSNTSMYTLLFKQNSKKQSTTSVPFLFCDAKYVSSNPVVSGFLSKNHSLQFIVVSCRVVSQLILYYMFTANRSILMAKSIYFGCLKHSRAVLFTQKIISSRSHLEGLGSSFPNKKNDLFCSNTERVTAQTCVVFRCLHSVPLVTTFISVLT